ncbi:hypothetical protein SSPIM334S_04395 [Streptomyces spiroverticillatus]|uniref:non-ribosomal peptide synthetase n=1 Tax=Streptomyces finlayi TaxID=67296 RepID=UPI001E34BD55|nr:non-ribosomal peptide synthetase [Streptomyces finlayi]
MTAVFAERAARTPDALALADGDKTLTYRQLSRAADGLAAHLIDGGVLPGAAVALLVRRSARTVVAQLALWRAGAVCVPLDPAHPRARTEAVLADSGAVLTVGDADLLEAAGLEGPQMVLEPDLPAYDGVTALPGPGPDATAFIMFTSGSTGRPKGVAVRHEAVAALVTDPSYVTVGPRDRVLLHSPATFDASTFEAWVALANGAAVVVCPADRPSFEDLARAVERHAVTVAFFTTALFHQLAARRSRVFGLLRSVVVGGEALSVRHAGAVLEAYPWLELVNGYGPTETTTFATAHRVTEADLKGPMPVGRPIASATAHVLGLGLGLGEDGHPVGEGEIGELWIGGTRLAAGYVGRPELTAERFVEHPGRGRLYRTGDLASFRADGVLDFHGRADDQVKVRGHRIEPGEIEHALRELGEVEDAAVTVRRAAQDDVRLAAFVVLRSGSSPDVPALRAALADRLPAYLVPDELTVVDRLPLTASGKVDRRALTEPGPPSWGGAGAVGIPEAPDELDAEPGAGPGTANAEPGTGTAPGTADAERGTSAAPSPPDPNSLRARRSSGAEQGHADTHNSGPEHGPGRALAPQAADGPTAMPDPGTAHPVTPAADIGPRAERKDGRVAIPAPRAEHSPSAGPASGAVPGHDPVTGPGTTQHPGAGSGATQHPGAGSGATQHPVTAPGTSPAEPGFPAQDEPGGVGSAPALTPLQAVVADVWARSLGCEVVAPDDDFLALGGHSLLALVVTDDLREDLGVELTLADFFAAPTVAGHAALVERALLATHGDPRPAPLDAPEHTDVP